MSVMSDINKNDYFYKNAKRFHMNLIYIYIYIRRWWKVIELTKKAMVFLLIFVLYEKLKKLEKLVSSILWPRRSKSWCPQETLFNYSNDLFVLVPLVGSRRRKKDQMESESTPLTRQREATYYVEKERADTDLEFPSCFSVVFLTCLSVGSRLV